MGALPKRKISKARKGKRRSSLKIEIPSLATCPKCGQPKLPHTVCQNCGTYKDLQVLKPTTQTSVKKVRRDENESKK
ncbi:MAG: 50S ribosomal protein L32 [Candidatus Woykebacteria bacterium RIFCSPHIGHO2_01_FULL_39_12]|uniref:Large ribosomal subunit protein bL32 n=1 Tax=Candidatus Woykebacteria bacterium RIFCSPHIGHO2_01_FULL_39_12 TaxID=1802599 RepID=A0A1G1WI03_9BACT|nr:MAG: 50S ribosomal protein L32 [Candidatus Woykebacteria bacterium RIFCSPHIGHO2_01_FULL_39_12]